MAGLVGFTPINTQDRDLQLVQNELSRCIGQFSANPLLTGVLRKASFTAVDSDVIVPHNLGSSNVGWIVGTLSLPAIIFMSPTGANGNQIILRCEQLSGVTVANTISSKNPLTAYVWAFLNG